MDRRSFLGSLLGTVAGSSFFAKLITDEPQRIVIPDWRMAFRVANSDELLQAPGVAEIIKHPNGYEFIAEPLATQQTIAPTATCLFDKHGRLILESRFHCGPINMVAGDTLKVTQKLTIDNLEHPEARRALSSPFEMAETFIKHRPVKA